MAAVDSVHWGLDGFLTLATGVIGWIVKTGRDDRKELEAKHDAFVGEAGRTFARRDDVKGALDDIKAQYAKMNDKLDRLIERR